MLSSRTGLSPRMVGRKAEIRELRRLLELAFSRQEPAVALLTGEAGVGKTRLLRELIATAPRGTVILAGHADERDMERPFSVVREAIQDAVQGWEEVPEALGRYGHALVHLLSPLLPVRDHPADGHSHGADELLRAGVALTRHLAGAGPAIIILDDLHWADAESIELFRRLATAKGLPGLVVGAMRPEHYRPEHQLARMLDTLSRQRDLIEIPLTSLTHDELQAFLAGVHGGPVTAGVVDALHDRTQGNPFFVEELIEAALSAPGGPGEIWTDPDALSNATLPWTAAEAVRHRLGGLRSEDRRVVEVAAVLGRQFSFGLLCSLLDLEEDDLLDVCRRLVAAGILVEEGSDDFAFRHALTREAVTKEMLSLERRRIHAQALQALERAGERCQARLARHALGADDRTRTKRYVRLAAQEALKEGAPRQALHYTRLGLAITQDDLTLHAVAARAAADVGRLNDAARHAGRWADIAERQGQPAEQCHAHCLQMWINWSEGDISGAWAATEAAMTAAERSGDVRAIARSRAVRAQIHLNTGQAGDAVHWAGKAIEVAEQAGLRDVRAHALVTQGTALAEVLADEGEFEVIAEARQLVNEGRQEAEALGHTETLIRALHNLLLVGQGLTAIDEARPLLQEARDTADRLGHERFSAKVARLEAWIALAEGSRAGVEAALQAWNRATPAPADRIWCATMETTLLLEGGDVEAARRALEGYWPAVRSSQDLHAQMDFASAEAGLAAATGDAQLGASALRRASESVKGISLLSGSVWWEVAMLALEAGVDPAVVREAAKKAPARVALHAGLIEQFDAALHAAIGDFEAAIRALMDSLDKPQGSRPAFLVAEGHRRLAELLASAGREDEAKPHARRAVALLERWPGRRFDAANRLAAQLDRVGTPAALTRREREVIQLVVQGLSNREIAGTLFISQKTAATHVSNILSKTGLKTRAQAAAWAVEHGIAHASQPLQREGRNV